MVLVYLILAASFFMSTSEAPPAEKDSSLDDFVGPSVPLTEGDEAPSDGFVTIKSSCTDG